MRKAIGSLSAKPHPLTSVSLSFVNIVAAADYLLLDLCAFLLLLLLRPTLRTLRGFLAAIGLTVHVPAFRLIRRAETNNARTFTGTGIVAACHKLRLQVATGR